MLRQQSFLATRRGKYTLALLCAIAFLDFIDASIVNIALPDIRKDLKFSVQDLQWVLSGYLLTYGGFMLLGGRAADLLGRRRVLVTGHTGFKGAWLAFWLSEMGAEVSGLALAPDTSPNLHDILSLPERGRFVQADINDRAALDALVDAARPQVVFHLAAQALVRRSYATPVETFATKLSKPAFSFR